MKARVLLLVCLIAWTSTVQGRGGRQIAQWKNSARKLAMANSIRHDTGPKEQKTNDWTSAPTKYRSNAELLQYLHGFAKRCGHITRLYSIGRSTRGVPLMALEISDRPGVEEPEPAVKFVGNIHGDEPLGRVLLPMLAEYLCYNYNKDPLATMIVDRTHLHILPAMNPDGFANHSRNNAANVDLNRDFPDQFKASNNNESLRQPETKAIMQWTRRIHFTMSATFHEGALVASYGWDGTADEGTHYAKSPDDAALHFLAETYARGDPQMRESQEFKGGITNGAAWYPLYGGMQDWNYLQGDCFDITIEANEEKWPPASEFPKHWDLHKKSLLEFASLPVKTGIHGTVLSASSGKPLVAATVHINGIQHETRIGKLFGDFYRILAPGQYQLSFSFANHKTHTILVNVTESSPTLIKVLLQPLPPQ